MPKPIDILLFYGAPLIVCRLSFRFANRRSEKLFVGAFFLAIFLFGGWALYIPLLVLLR